MANHRCAVLGKPVAHSLSPVLHNAAYRSLKLDDWLYDTRWGKTTSTLSSKALTRRGLA